jgi:hypothetical protein
MNKVIGVIGLILLIFVFVGCDLRQELVSDYCDKEVSYNLWKQKSGYWLNLHVGLMDAGVCRVNPSKHRTINLSRLVSSPEEADRLVEKYRRAYAEKLTRPKVE